MFRVGLEHEFVFVNQHGEYLDADVSSYAVFGAIVEAFPAFEHDDQHFQCKSLERYPKRCYVEGFERHDPDGTTVETLPKGLEIRTQPHASVAELLAEFRQSFAEMVRLAGGHGLSPVLSSNHPFKKSIALDHRLDSIETEVRTAARLALAKQAMTTHGFHINVSLGDASEERMRNLVEKVNYYTPSLIPWSFSSPFYEGKLFEGVCARNYQRAETREMVGLVRRKGGIVLEFRGFDACGDARLLESLMLLYCGFLMDESLGGRSPDRDVERLKRSSLRGFDDPSLRDEARQVLRAAQAALGSDSGPLERLESMLAGNDSYSMRMKRRFAETGSIIECISGQYDY